MSLRYRSLVILLLIFCGAGSSRAGWNKVGQFSDGVGCGYFFDENNGIIGLGHFSHFLSKFLGPKPLLIYWTSDGGTNWNPASIPLGGTGRITSIFMKDKSEGYASIYSEQYSLWKTTDGGKTWFDFSLGNNDLSTCIYATANELTKTTWFGNPGGTSFDGGKSYRQDFSNANLNGSDGIDFSGNNGIVTSGPGGGSWFTQNGGISWQVGFDLPESWSVYALQGTQYFFCLPEDYVSSVNAGTVYWSQDGGINWQNRFTFTGISTFTGHIAGAGSTLYVQTDNTANLGVFRSDDLGLTWKNVGGPSNDRDTRFVVIGCRGEIVYAFDTSGGVWKTTDGGDGTLSTPSVTNMLAVTEDTLFLTSICIPSRSYFHLKNTGCSLVSIDSITFLPDNYHEFSIDTAKIASKIIENGGLGIPVVFTTDSNITRTTKILVHGNFNGVPFDVTIIVVAQHSSVAGPILALSQDSLSISGTCQPARGYFDLTDRNCDSLMIDSISFSPNIYREFSLDTVGSGIVILPNNSLGIPVLFRTDSSVTRQTLIHIHAHSKIRTIDTTIILNASHATIDGPLLALANDSLSISASCVPVPGVINLTNRNCDSLIIDSIDFSPDLYGEFTFDTVKSDINILSNASVGIPILFQCDSDITRKTFIHIHAHSTNRVIDTTIILEAQHSTVPGPLLALAFDSVYMETRYCQPLRRYIDLSNLNCNGLVIDSVILSPQYPELIIDTTQQPKLSLAKFSSVGIPIFFQTDSNLTRSTTIRIIAHSLNRTIDTIIILVAKHSTAPEPLLVTPSKTKVGDTVLIPVFLRHTQDSFTIKHYAFHLSYDGDVLTPARGNPYQIFNTLSANSTVTMGSPEANGALCTIDLNNPITEGSDLSLPLIYLRMGVTLSRNLFSAITLDTFSISPIAPLPLCSIPATMFLVDPLCGDSILSKFMFNGTMPGFLSIRPNPNSGGVIEAEVLLAEETGLSLDISDAHGSIVQRTFLGSRFEKGIQTLKIAAPDLSDGAYFIRLHLNSGNFFTTRIVISK